MLLGMAGEMDHWPGRQRFWIILWREPGWSVASPQFLPSRLLLLAHPYLGVLSCSQLAARIISAKVFFQTWSRFQMKPPEIMFKRNSFKLKKSFVKWMQDDSIFFFFHLKTGIIIPIFKLQRLHDKYLILRMFGT